MGRDVGRDEGRDQAAWRDLVARLELMSPIDPEDAPWPDRENLPAKPQSSATRQLSADDLFAPSESKAGEAGEATASSKPDETIGAADGEATAPAATVEQAEPKVAPDDPGSPSGESDAQGSGTETKRDARPERPPTNRSRIIRPAAGYPRFGRVIPRQVGPSAHAHDQDAARRGGAFDPLDDAGRTGTGGPRDFSLADDTEFDFGDGDRYIPPPLPPMGRVDPVAAIGWAALFGGPAYLLISMLADWQTPRWTALIAVIGFVAGFIVLVFRLGDSQSKRDGPDQGAVV